MRISRSSRKIEIHKSSQQFLDDELIYKLVPPQLKIGYKPMKTLIN